MTEPGPPYRRAKRRVVYTMSAAAEFQKELGAKVALRLGPDYEFRRSKHEIRREVSDGYNVVILSGSNKYSPFVEVAFYFGKAFSAARTIERKLGLYGFPCHVQQYSPNCAVRRLGTYGGPFSWSVDITQPPKRLAEDLAGAIEGLTKPFYERYGDIRAARDAIADGDRNVFGGEMFWRQLLYLDLALHDLAHFDKWSLRLDDLSRNQADDIVRKYNESYS